MRLGICPQCKSSLEEFDHFFCSKCGFQLPIELINPEVPFSRKNPTVAEILAAKKQSIVLQETKAKILKGFLYINDPKNRKTYLVGLLFILLGIFGTQIYGKYIGTTVIKKPVKVESEPQSALAAIDLQLPLTSDVFAKESLINYIPATVDLYARVNDVKSLAKVIPHAEFLPIAFIESTTNHVEIFRLTTANGGQWGVLFRVTNKEEIQKILAANSAGSVGSTQFWKYKLIDNVLIATSNEEVFKMVTDASNRVAMNLNLNSKFITAVAKVQKEGKILLVLLNDKGKEELTTAKTYIPGELFSRIVEATVKSGYNEVVIN